MGNKKPSILAIIPARKGSKGIARKNLRPILGKPLITYTIESALEAKWIEKVIVSTDDQQIERICTRMGAEVINRPAQLATDDSPVIDSVFHVLDFLKKEGYEPDIVVVLQPTSPLRNVKDVEKAIALYVENDCESLISVCETKDSPYWAFRMARGFIKPLMGLGYLNKRRQELPRTLSPNGAIFISTPQSLSYYGDFYTNKTIPYLMPRMRSIDIDDELDLSLAERVMEGRLKRLPKSKKDSG